MPFPSPLFRLVYHSQAVESFTPEALDMLLRRARSRNAQHRISGLLLYSEGRFLQVIEGPGPALDRLYSLIEADPRHCEVRTLAYEPLTTRAFPDWRMGYLPVEAAALEQATGFLSLAATPGFAAHPPAELWELLRSFAQGQLVDG
ncbi:hypothetical protein CDA63_01690 [Hymenobacter amundsenii]|uniref:BLUF domain-containing protein n=1 Tax=Hymenobacter amundsenii TaxID=2006685 RepID=A0A246FQS7_9BACT|nr:BLUF domain-containing protein [Hymenobacter amundsenii]OWP65093.1 hypothetical protein CDA63_01690 [Hymenobacter amundsenii]